MSWSKYFNTFFHFGRCVASLGGLTFAYQRLQPAPVAYGKCEFNSMNSKDPVNDPKAQIKFGNVGFGPMYLHSLVIRDKNDKVISPDLAFKQGACNKFVLDSSSKKLFGQHISPRAWKTDALVPLLTIRPSRDEYAANGDFATDFFDKLKNDGIYFEVTTACSDLYPLNRFKTTRKLYVPVNEKDM